MSFDTFVHIPEINKNSSTVLLHKNVISSSANLKKQHTTIYQDFFAWSFSILIENSPIVDEGIQPTLRTQSSLVRWLESGKLYIQMKGIRSTQAIQIQYGSTAHVSVPTLRKVTIGKNIGSNKRPDVQNGRDPLRDDANPH